MRTFIIRARKGTTRWDRVQGLIGPPAHFEVVAHSVINAFFISSDFRKEVEMYIILDSSEDFPRAIKLSSQEKLSLPGFHEMAVVSLIADILKQSQGLKKDGHLHLAPGVEIFGFGFEKLISTLLPDRSLYLLDIKGTKLESCSLATDPVFILSDHLALPKKSVQGLKRQGVQPLSLGKTLLFASQCIVLLHHTLDSRAASC